MGPASVIISIILIFAITVTYTAINNAHSLEQTDRIEALNARKVELAAEKERLQIEATRLQSIQEIQKTSTSGSKFVPTTKINYLPSTNVAVK